MADQPANNPVAAEVKKKLRELHDLVMPIVNSDKDGKINQLTLELKEREEKIKSLSEEMEDYPNYGGEIETGNGEINYSLPPDLWSQQVMEVIDRLMKKIGPLPLLSQLELLIEKFKA